MEKITGLLRCARNDAKRQFANFHLLTICLITRRCINNPVETRFIASEKTSRLKCKRFTLWLSQHLHTPCTQLIQFLGLSEH